MYNADYYFDNPDKAIKPLAEKLVAGELAIVLGAGASSGLGMPRWWELVKKCIEISALDCNEDITEKTTNERLTEITELIQTKAANNEEFIDWVERSLYPVSVPPVNNLVKHDLLIAVGALIMGSKRGHVDSIVTLNYDDIIEWYLTIHGFCPQVITKTPYVEKHADVSIIHAHGFLPKYTNEFEANREIVFSKMDYDSALGDQNHPLYNVLMNVLERKYCLFIGVNRRDPLWGQKLTNLKIGDRDAGFWFFKRCEEDNEILGWARNRKVIPLFLSEYADIPGYLLRICQRAARMIMK